MTQLDDDDVKDLKQNVKTFVSKLQALMNERAEINERIKDLKDEFKGEFDMKTLALALKVAKAENEVAHKFVFDQMIEVLRDDFAVLP